MANRPKLTIEDQVAYMKNKGITFDHCSEKDAVRFLQESTYFFKVKAFDKNYIAHPKTGHYYNLDFSYLMELSTLDMRLRRLILHATLDIEHFLKVQLIRDVSSNPVEDGYQIVEKFFSENSSVKNSISEKLKNSMCKDLVEKLESENYAIWNLIEVLSFGDFVRLYTLYDREYGNHNKGLIQCLYAVRCLRNAAAHNNCLLNSLRLPYTRKIHSSYSISRAVSQIPNGPKTTSREKKLANPVIHDFVAMLYVYKKIVSSPRTAEHFTKELHDLFDIRMKRHSNYFESNECISSAYHFMKTVINDWFPSGQEL